jgi:Antimicrobial peptide resistance and lipid A acylation protein PagP
MHVKRSANITYDATRRAFSCLAFAAILMTPACAVGMDCGMLIDFLASPCRNSVPAVLPVLSLRYRRVALYGTFIPKVSRNPGGNGNVGYVFGGVQF